MIFISLCMWWITCGDHKAYNTRKNDTFVKKMQQAFVRNVTFKIQEESIECFETYLVNCWCSKFWKTLNNWLYEEMEVYVSFSYILWIMMSYTLYSHCSLFFYSSSGLSHLPPAWSNKRPITYIRLWKGSMFSV